jgi:hypothetical protein
MGERCCHRVTDTTGDNLGKIEALVILVIDVETRQTA